MKDLLKSGLHRALEEIHLDKSAIITVTELVYTVDNECGSRGLATYSTKGIKKQNGFSSYGLKSPILADNHVLNINIK